MMVLLGWLVHLITSLSAVLALFGFYAVSQGNDVVVLMILVLTVIIDAVDGPLARLLKVKKTIPNFDGAMLDNIVDFTSWVVLPAFLILKSNIFPNEWRTIFAIGIILSSCYQFCCTDLKDETSTFKRWPSAWSLVVICLFLWTPPLLVSLPAMIVLFVLSFIPISFIHPLRLDLRFSSSPLCDKLFCYLLIVFSVLFSISLLYSIWTYSAVDVQIKEFQIFFRI